MAADEILEEILVGLGQGYEPLGRAGVLAAIRDAVGAGDIRWPAVAETETTVGSAS